MAWVIDVVVVTVVVIGASVVTAIFGSALDFSLDASSPAQAVTVDTSMAALHALVSTSLGGAYFVASWVLKGATPGQLILGMRVQRQTNGERPSFSGAVVRWILLFPPLGTIAALSADAHVFGAALWGAALVWQFALLLTIAFSPTRQGLHDRAAGTVVLRRGATPPAISLDRVSVAGGTRAPASGGQLP